jgi:DNA sulfur modification protein DndB
LAAHPHYPSDSRPEEAPIPVYDVNGPPLVTIAPELAIELAQASARGAVVYGTFINQNVITLGIDGYELEALTPDPNTIEDKKYLQYHSDLEDVANVRREVQRLFVKSKRDNARNYGQYIEAVEHGERLGFAPAPILWSKKLLKVIPLGLSNLCVVIIPRGVTLIAIDGETQIAGRFQSWERDESLKDRPFPVIIAHGRTEEWARQTFHDVNVFGVKPNAALAISMDMYDPGTQIARDLTVNIPFLENRVNMSARQLSKSDRKVGQFATISSLRGSIVTLEKGIGGVAIGTKSLQLAEADKKRLAGQATVWWNAMATHLGSAFLDPGSVASSPAALAALGAVGHRVFSRREDPQVHAASLARDVVWTKGDRWANIAGKYTSKGVFSLGGAKENAYAIYAALTDASDPEYRKIRR